MRILRYIFAHIILCKKIGSSGQRKRMAWVMVPFVAFLLTGIAEAAVPYGETIWLKSVLNDMVVTVDSTAGELLTASMVAAASDAELFMVEDAGSPYVYFKSLSTGLYAHKTSDRNRVKADCPASNLDTTAKFEWIETSDNQFRLLNESTGKYVKNYKPELRAGSTLATADETLWMWGTDVAPTPLGWHVVPADVDFPTDDVIVAICDVTEPNFNLPADTVNSDCTAAFQAALDTASAAGGGTVFVPEGEYRIEGQLIIEANVTLRGRWREITATQPASGTILSLYTEGDNGVITLDESGSGVRDLTFWHPEQDPNNINTNYAPVIDGDSGQITIQNITLVNAYIGIDMSSSSMCCLRDIYGSPLKTGLTADRSFAVSRYNGIHFSPDYWAWSGLTGCPALDGPHKSYIRSNGAAVNIKEMDGFHLMFSTISGYAKGLWFQAGASGDNAWGTIAYNTVTNCDVAVHLEDTKGIGMVRNTFEGSIYSLWIDEEVGGATLDTCVVDGDIYAVDKGVKLYNCTRTGNVLLGSGGTLTERTIIPATPEFDNTYDRVRKPYSTKLFNVKDYGAVGDGDSEGNGTDDTLAVQAAVAEANKDGGIVMFPAGQYVMTNNLVLTAGVELRGSSGGRHIAGRAALGSVLLIDDVGKNDPNGTPFITMGDNCGLRGMSFHYVDQDFRSFIPYPFMVQGNGVKDYIIDCFASNPYQAALMKGDDHLVEYTFFGGLRSTYRAEDCSGGRIQSCHVKPDFWRDYWIGLNNPRSDLGEFKSNVNQSLEVFYLKGCDNYSISSIFNHASHAFFTAEDSSGQTLLIGGEQIQKGYTFRNGTKTFNLINSGGNINSLGDATGSYGVKTESSFNGTANFFGIGNSGNQAKTYAAEGGELYIQRGSLQGYSAHGAMGMFCGPNGSLTMDSCSYGKLLGFENLGTVAMTNCEFAAGLVYSATEPLIDDNIINGTYLLADMNQNPIYEYGLQLLDLPNMVVVDALVYPKDYPASESTDGRRLESWESLTGEFGLDVTEPDYADGKNRIVTIEAYLLMTLDSTVDIYYDSVDGEKLGESFTMTSTSEWEKVSFNVSDALFDGTEDIRIVVSDGFTGLSPLLNYVVVESSRMPRDAIHTGNIELRNSDSDSTVDKIWTISGLNAADPDVTTANGTAIGTISAADDMGAAESFSLTATAVYGWTTAGAQAALETPGDFMTYLGDMPAGEVDASSGNLGVNSTAYQAESSTSRFGDGTPEAMVFTVDTDNLSSGDLYLLSLGFWSRLSSDYTDFVIYDVSENQVLEAQWHTTSSLNGNWKLEDGDLIVLGVDPSTTGDFRLSSVTLDVILPQVEDTTPPLAPTALAATPGDSSVSLDWADNGEGDLASYSVYRSTTLGSYGAALATGLATSAYADNTAVNGTTYYYVVTAVDVSTNESVVSAEVSATPNDTAPPVPNPITWESTPTTISSTEITMTATTASDSSGGVEYRFLNDTTGALSAWQSSPTWTATGLEPGSNYTFKVRTQDALGNAGNYSAGAFDTTMLRYDEWTATYGGEEVIGTSTNDYDYDGVGNLAEYALGGNPTNAAFQGTLPIFIKAGGGFEYIHPQRSDDPRLVYTVETRTNLLAGSWIVLDAVVGTNMTGESLNEVTNRVDTTEGKMFIHLRVDYNE